MNGFRARRASFVLAVVAACTAGPHGEGFGRLTASLGMGEVANVNCPLPPPNDFGSQCSWPAPGYAPPSMTTNALPTNVPALSSVFDIVSADANDSTQSDSVVDQVVETFSVDRDGHPGSVGLTLKLLTPTQVLNTDWDMYVDMYDLGAKSPTGVYTLPTPTDSTGLCDNLESYGSTNAFARGRFNTKPLILGADTPVRINFQALPGSSGVLVPEHQYAMVFYMESPGTSRIGIAANADTDPTTGNSVKYYTQGYLEILPLPTSGPGSPVGNEFTRQERLLQTNCFSSPPWVQDEFRDINFFLTLDDGCTLGDTFSCGQGSCYRTIDECDSYGNFQQCSPGYCTVDQDCVWNWSYPPAPTPPDWLAQFTLTPSGPQAGVITVDYSSAPTNTMMAPGLEITIVDPTDFTWTYPGSSMPSPVPIPAGGQYTFNMSGPLAGITLDFSNGTYFTGDTDTITWSGSGAGVQFGPVQWSPGAGTVKVDTSSNPSAQMVAPGIQINIVDDTDFTYTYNSVTSAVTTIPAGGNFSGPWPTGLTGVTVDFSSGHYIAGAQWLITWNSWGAPYTWAPQFVVSLSGNTPGTGMVTVDSSSTPSETVHSPGVVINVVDPSDFTVSYESQTSSPIAIPVGGSYAGPWPGTTGLSNLTVNFLSGTYTTGSIYTITWSYYGWYGPGSCVNPGGPANINGGHCIAQTEQCNGVDDDCNGQTDEGLGQATCGLGACFTSVYSCVDSVDSYGITIGTPANCQAFEPPSQPEVCNGIDDDCDGFTDNHLGDTTMCGSGPCRRAVYSCILQPGANGMAACDLPSQDCTFSASQFGRPAVCTPDYTQYLPESCNGIDDDCDGVTDDWGGPESAGPFNYRTLWQYYYPPPSQADITLANYYQFAPMPWTQPVPAAPPPPVPPHEPSTSAPTLGQCHYGHELCSAVPGSGVPSWTPDSMNLAVTPQPEEYPPGGIYVCDGLDNDCDGFTDNIPGVATPMFRSYWPKNATAFHPATTGTYVHENTGACQDGVETCYYYQTGLNALNPDQNGNPDSPFWRVTTQPVTASAERCNGIDDDCNGLTDDGFGSQICGNGVCRTVVQNCQCNSMGCIQLGANCASGGSVNQGNVGNASAEACNGLDDDCDGRTDNIQGTPVPLNVECHPLCDSFHLDSMGNPICKYLGGTAAQGICSPGAEYCVAVNGTASYQACGAYGAPTEIGPRNETCNGLDDDCDGATDNVPNTTASLAQACSSQGQRTPFCIPQTGQCKQGTSSCVGGAYGSCANEVGPSGETCNGYDDDCDGYTDNVPGTATPMTQPGSWSGEIMSGLVTTCGTGTTFPYCIANTTTPVGRCNAGTESCLAAMWTTATGVIGPSTELCNAMDDDCDGYTDNVPGTTTAISQLSGWGFTDCNGYPGCVVAMPVGQCQQGTQTCLSTGVWSAGGQGAMGYVGPSHEVCNGYDDDCDGWTDNSVGTSTKLQQISPWQDVVGSGGPVTDCGVFPFPSCNTATPTGQCQPGTESCVSPGWSGPTGYVGPSQDICNALDDDCDGFTDNLQGTTTKLTTAFLPWGNGVNQFNQQFNLVNGYQATIDILVAGTQTSQCRLGTGTCDQISLNGLYSTSFNPVGPSIDWCNGYDDDCDGWTDNLPGTATALSEPSVWFAQDCEDGPAMGPCMTGADCPGAVCDTMTGHCLYPYCNPNTATGQCKGGSQTCIGGGWVGTATGVVGPSMEVCNGWDDDCDGYTDNQNPGSQTPALSQVANWYQDIVTGFVANCGTGTQFPFCNTATSQGACFPGTQSCGMPVAGQYGFPQGIIRPSVEACNGVDDDCDGRVDNVPGTSTPLTQAVYSVCGSFCASTFQPTNGQCAPGTQTCEAAMFVTTQAAIGPSFDACNGFDDDCDSWTDNVPSWSPGAYYSTGTIVISGTGTMWNEYVETAINSCLSGSTPPFPGTGTGIADNQCQWSYVQPAGPQPWKLNTTYQWSAADCNGFPYCRTDTNVGQCKPGSANCNTGMWSGNYDYVGPSTDLCNGYDDDCDGWTDNVPGSAVNLTTAFWPAAAGNNMYQNPVGTWNSPFTFTATPGYAPTNGQCAIGTGTCDLSIVNGLYATSTAPVGPSIEICNGLDDDCDGQTDNIPNSMTPIMQEADWGTVVASNWILTCGNSDLGSFPFCSTATLTGQCYPGTQSCTTPFWQTTATGIIGPSTDYCNGLDDDCDGYTDNVPGTSAKLTTAFFPAALGMNSIDGVSYASFTATPGYSPFKGQCLLGTGTCDQSAVNGLYGTSTPPTGPSVETCNGYDDDCDGVTDNIPGTMGPIWTSATWADVVAGGWITTCGNSAMGSFPYCNTSTQTGQCFAGTQTCFNSVQGNAAASWALNTASGIIGPSTDWCNGLDDDCDGYTDNVPEAPWGVGVSYGSGAQVTSNGGLYTAEAACMSGGLAPSGMGTGINDGGCLWDYVQGLPLHISQTADWAWEISQGSTFAINCGPSSGYPACITTSATGQCSPGTETCSGFGGANPWNTPVGIIRPSGEVCNGLDDDCDGYIDNQLSTTIKVTRTGDWQQDIGQGWLTTCGNSNAGSFPYCNPSTATGQCFAGTQSCQNAVVGSESGSWLLNTATGIIGPSTEICNSLDDDCDGYTDNNPGTTVPIAQLADWRVTIADHQVTTCGTGTLFPECIANTSTAQGQCYPGTQTCGSGNWGVPSGAIGPSTELCNGYDDDCDGLVDNVYEPPWTAGTMYTVAYNVASGGNLYKAEAACTAGSTAPTGTGTGISDGAGGCLWDYVQSLPVILSRVASWSGDIAANWVVNGSNQPDCGTGNFPNCKVTTSYGQCYPGTQSCLDVCDPMSGICTANYGHALGIIGPSLDWCNGLDDDCDGVTDNVPGGTATLTTATAYSCNSLPSCIPYSHSPYWEPLASYVSGNQVTSNGNIYTETVASCTSGSNAPSGTMTFSDGTCSWNYVSVLNIGQCRAGTNTCGGAGGYTTVTQGAVGASTDFCNGFDDDCDGYTDNVPGGPTKLTSAWWPLNNGTNQSGAQFGMVTGYQCNSPNLVCLGQCKVGTGTCDNSTIDGVYTTSTPPVGPSIDYCNGFDDDCDGYTDNVPGSSVKLTTAFWPDASAMNQIGVSFTATPHYAPTNGQCSLGTGTCDLSAINGLYATSTPPNGPSVDFCNGLDDDCDGFTDNRPGTSTKLTTAFWPSATATNQFNVTFTSTVGYGPSVGQCKIGTGTCDQFSNSGTYSTSTAPVSPSMDLCNGYDDDCDGYVDLVPSVAWAPTTTYQLGVQVSHAGNLYSAVPTSWAATTTYPAGAQVFSGGKLYLQVAAMANCMSASSAPSGYGSAIADGTCSWSYELASPYAWTPSTVYSPGAVLSNAGNFYIETATPSCTSAVSGGPSGGTFGTTGIVDSSCRWSYVSPASTCTSGSSGPSTMAAGIADGTCTWNYVQSSASAPPKLTSAAIPSSSGTNQSGFSFGLAYGYEPTNGQCAVGTATCNSAAFAVTTPSVGPSVDACNGFDDDCDGYTDNWPYQAWVSGGGYSLNQVVASNGGLWTAQGGCTAGSTAPSGTMNTTDGGCSWTYSGTVPVKLTTALYPTSSGTNALTQFPFSATVGYAPTNAQCKLGTATCDQVTIDGMYTQSTAPVGPSGDWCNGLDDDCDGFTDNIPTLPSPTNGATFYAGDQVKVGGKFYWETVATCASAGTALSGTGTNIADGTCSWNYAPQGPVWGTSKAYTATSQVVANGNIYIETAANCTSFGSGAGPSGTSNGIGDGSCSWNFVQAVSTPLKLSTAFYPPGNGTNQNGAVFNTVSGYSPANGQCRIGTGTCDWNGVAGQFVTSTQPVGPSIDYCNGWDDDCDGATDNVPGQPGTKLTTAWYPIASGANLGGFAFSATYGYNCTAPNLSCNGTCKVGTGTCDYVSINGAYSQSTSPTNPSQETCNGFDDDCDGYTDNLPYQMWAPSIHYSTGLIRASTTTIPGSLWQAQACAGNAGTIWPTPPSSPFFDGNCNWTYLGTVSPVKLTTAEFPVGSSINPLTGQPYSSDYNYANMIANLNTGTTLSQCKLGTGTCDNTMIDGVYTQSTAPVSPSVEVCNGFDDDCDTYIDNVPFLQWAVSTTYQLGEQVYTGSGASAKIYATVPTAWTSGGSYSPGSEVTSGSRLYVETGASSCTAGSTAPTGTGAGISDGACLWTFVALGPYPWTSSSTYVVGVVVANGGNLYKETAAGSGGPPATCTSGSSGPSGTGSGISDGSCTWTYLAPASTCLSSSSGTGPSGTGSGIADGTCTWNYVQLLSSGGSKLTSASWPSASTNNPATGLSFTATVGYAPWLGQCSLGSATCFSGSYSVNHTGTSPVQEACNGYDDDCDGYTDNVAQGATGYLQWHATTPYGAGTTVQASDGSFWGWANGNGTNTCTSGSSSPTATPKPYCFNGICCDNGVTPVSNGSSNYKCTGGCQWNNIPSGTPLMLTTATSYFCNCWNGVNVTSSPGNYYCAAQSYPYVSHLGTSTCTPGAGLCQPGLNYCNASTPGTPSWGLSQGIDQATGAAEVGPGLETCNNSDDDCDGVTDDGYELMNDANSMCLVQNTTANSTGYEVSAALSVTTVSTAPFNNYSKGVGPPCSDPWVQGTTYSPGTMVTFNGTVYGNLAGSNCSSSSAHPTNWATTGCSGGICCDNGTAPSSGSCSSGCTWNTVATGASTSQCAISPPRYDNTGNSDPAASWWGGCVVGWSDQDTSYADGCECEDDAWASLTGGAGSCSGFGCPTTAPVGCTSASNTGCSSYMTNGQNPAYSCLQGLDLCSVTNGVVENGVPVSTTSCSGAACPGGTAVCTNDTLPGGSGGIGSPIVTANVTASIQVKGWIPNQMWHDFYYVNLPTPSFNQNRQVTDNISVQLDTLQNGGGTPSAAGSPVFYMHVYMTGGYSDWQAPSPAPTITPYGNGPGGAALPTTSNHPCSYEAKNSGAQGVLMEVYGNGVEFGWTPSGSPTTVPPTIPLVPPVMYPTFFGFGNGSVTGTAGNYCNPCNGATTCATPNLTNCPTEATINYNQNTLSYQWNYDVPPNYFPQQNVTDLTKYEWYDTCVAGCVSGVSVCAACSNNNFFWPGETMIIEVRRTGWTPAANGGNTNNVNGYNAANGSPVGSTTNPLVYNENPKVTYNQVQALCAACPEGTCDPANALHCRPPRNAPALWYSGAVYEQGAVIQTTASTGNYYQLQNSSCTAGSSGGTAPNCVSGNCSTTGDTCQWRYIGSDMTQTGFYQNQGIGTVGGLASSGQGTDSSSTAGNYGNIGSCGGPQSPVGDIVPTTNTQGYSVSGSTPYDPNECSPNHTYYKLTVNWNTGALP
jgi:hypothetical protein